MKVISFLLIGLFIISTAMAKPEIPKLYIQYSPIFDLVCSKNTNYKIESQWIDEIKAKSSLLTSNWEDEGKKLLEMTLKIVGKPFERKELMATLSACSFPSMSHPLLINMRYALKSFTENPVPIHVTLSIIYHEILHLYLQNKIPEKSPLLREYASEHPRVLRHLHLFSLQKAAYIRLNWEEKLRDVVSKDSSLPGGYYKKAWHIINEIKGHSSFIEELRR